MPRSNMLQCVGLVTYTSETRSPEGALVVADNVNVDEPNVITPRRGLEEYKNIVNANDESELAKQLLIYKDTVLRHRGSTLEYDTDGNAFVPFAGDYEELAAGLRIKGKEFNGNFFFTSTEGIQKISALTKDEFTSDAGYIVPAGVRKPTDLTVNVVPTVGGFMPPQSRVAYRALLGYRDSNNVLVLGAPSARVVATNITKDINVSEQSLIEVDTTSVTARDFILLNSTQQSYVLWFDVSGSDIPPASAQTVGKEFIRINVNGYQTDTQTLASRIAQEIIDTVSEFQISVFASTVTIRTIAPGNTIDITTGFGFTSGITVETQTQGSIATAVPANVELTVALPASATTDYFFQIYRSRVVTVTEGVRLENIAPDDEMQLVFEAPITATDITNRSIIVTDVTPEIFRAAGLPLYTNPNTGETILQANEIPPVARDVEVFRNVMFYANTRYFHQKEMTIVSVDDFVSGDTQFYIGTEQGIQSYTFVGDQEITDITVAPKSRTVGSSYITLNSDSNINKYYLWFDKGTVTGEFDSVGNVDEINDRIMIVSHGFETNDKVIPSGRLPGGLVAGNEYFVVRVDDDNIQFVSNIGDAPIALSENPGIQEETELTVASKARTVGGSYFTLNSGDDTNRYYVWFNKGVIVQDFDSASDVNVALAQITINNHGLETNDAVVASGTLPAGLVAGETYYVIRIDNNALQLSETLGGAPINYGTVLGTGTLTHTSVDPVVSGRTGVEVDLAVAPSTIQGTRDAVNAAIVGIPDISSADGVAPSVVIITNDTTGVADDITFSSPSPGIEWSFDVTAQGVSQVGFVSHISNDPSVQGRVGIKVDLSQSDDDIQGTRDAINLSLLGLGDFISEDALAADVVTVINANNGNADDASFGSLAPGPLWALDIVQQGDGESVRGSFSALSVASPMVVTAEDHGLKTGDFVRLVGDTTTDANGTYEVAFIDKDSFSVAYDNSLGVTDSGRFVEDGNAVLLSSLPSVSQSIDETARSLVQQINLNPNSPVDAFYLSGPQDLPGNILLQRRTLSRVPFYTAISDASLSGEFNPELPAINTISAIEFSNGANSPAKIVTAAPHGLANSTDIYISCPDTVPALAGKYTITFVSPTEFTVPVNITTEDPIAANSFYYLATVESDNAEVPNRLYFSKTGQPEAVPTLNFLDIGNRDQGIDRILALRDNLFVLKNDGIYLIFGDANAGFRDRLLDRNAAISAPDSAVTLNNQIFMLADQGVVSVSESGAKLVSRLIEDKFKAVTNPRYNFTTTCFGVSYETDRAYLIWLPTSTTDVVATQCYRYNIFEETWTRWTVPATCGTINTLSDDKLYLGSGVRPYVLQERKLGVRDDFADRSFELFISPSGYNVTSRTLVVSSAAEVELGDVVDQQQYVTVSVINRLLQKLDIDSGVASNNYFSLFSAEPGENLAIKLNDIQGKLVQDLGNVAIDEDRIFINELNDMREKFDELISELNSPGTDTSFKNYKPIDGELGTIPYEAIVTGINKSNNTITINTPSAFIEGAFRLYKGVKHVIQWSPIHYGDPMAYKQVSSASCIFDQNNFYDAKMAFSSDLSPAFAEVRFFGKGIGYWGSSTWGDLNLYWGGDGSDVPYRDIIPLDKQRCRYHNVRFTHVNAREYFRILGVTSNVRAYSDRAYRGMRN